jgi:ribosome-associated inhibitor A
MNITDAIRARVESRFEKLSRFDVPLINPHVIITSEPNSFKIEANITIPNNQLFAEADHEDLYAAINQLGQKLERQLNRYLKKPVAHRGTRSGKAMLKDIPEEQVD